MILLFLFCPLSWKTIYVGWKRPQEAWIKFNINDACKDRGEIVECGCLFCDSDHRCIKDYSKKIVACDGLHVALRCESCI